MIIKCKDQNSIFADNLYTLLNGLNGLKYSHTSSIASKARYLGAPNPFNLESFSRRFILMCPPPPLFFRFKFSFLS